MYAKQSKWSRNVMSANRESTFVFRLAWDEQKFYWSENVRVNIFQKNKIHFFVFFACQAWKVCLYQLNISNSATWLFSCTFSQHAEDLTQWFVFFYCESRLMALYNNGGLVAPRLFIGLSVKSILNFFPCSPNVNFYQWSSIFMSW